MILNYLKAGYPCLYMLTQEPHRTEELLPCPGWKFTTWDCIQGIRVKGEQTVLDIINPTDTIQWLNTQQGKGQQRRSTVQVSAPRQPMPHTRCTPDSTLEQALGGINAARPADSPGPSRAESCGCAQLRRGGRSYSQGGSQLQPAD